MALFHFNSLAFILIHTEMRPYQHAQFTSRHNLYCTITNVSLLSTLHVMKKKASTSAYEHSWTTENAFIQ